MLIALITVMLLGGGGGGLLDLGAIKKEIKSFMASTEQRKAALDLVKAGEKSAKAQSKLTNQTAKRIGKAVADHEVDLADVDAIWTEYHNATMKHHRELVELRFQLKQHISPEEWAAIFSE